MNRADRMLSVLKTDAGSWFDRWQIFNTVGFMLTNNAASELRARGVQVEHRKRGRIDEYRLVSS